MIPQVILQEKREKSGLAAIRNARKFARELFQSQKRKRKKRDLRSPRTPKTRHASRSGSSSRKTACVQLLLKHKNSTSRSWSAPGPVRELESPKLLSLSSTPGHLRPRFLFQCGLLLNSWCLSCLRVTFSYDGCCFCTTCEMVLECMPNIPCTKELLHADFKSKIKVSL